jgi:hypothetical protein
MVGVLEAMKDLNEKIEWQLDWSSRHLKNLQKQYPPTPEHECEAIYMFGILKTSCELLNIDLQMYLKMTDLPYRERNGRYSQLFTSLEPYESRIGRLPAVGTFSDLIGKLKGTSLE